MPPRPDPVSDADDAGRAQSQALLAAARFGALAYTDPETGTPGDQPHRRRAGRPRACPSR